MVMGKPIPNKLSWGEARVNMPSAMLVINSAATTGKDNCTPDLKIIPLQLTICKKNVIAGPHAYGQGGKAVY